MTEVPNNDIKKESNESNIQHFICKISCPQQISQAKDALSCLECSPFSAITLVITASPAKYCLCNFRHCG